LWTVETKLPYCDKVAERRIRVGVAGAGYWGANLIRVCNRLGVLESVCDVEETARASVAWNYPSVNVVARYEELLRRPIDAVVVATPAFMHADMALAGLAAGKHIFVEKPLALSVADGERVADAAASARRVAFVGHLLLYHPAVRTLRSLVERGEIGSLRHVRSRRLSLGKLRTEENVWWSFAPHDVALIIALMGEAPSLVSSAQTRLRNAPLNDVAYADFEFSDGRSAHVEVSWLDPEKCSRIDVFGERGVITFSDSKDRSSLWLRRLIFGQNDAGVPVVGRGQEQLIDVEPAEPLELEMLAFLDAVEFGTPFESTVRHGVAVLKTLSQADAALTRWTQLRAFA
jgi:UDP-2-acetamido-3-amino-2,3-dideoxy-glucuronate N-acetyltransferase